MYLKPKQTKHIVIHPHNINFNKTVGGIKEISSGYLSLNSVGEQLVVSREISVQETHGHSNHFVVMIE